MSFLDPSSIRIEPFGIWFVFVLCVLLPAAAVRGARKTKTVELTQQRIALRLRTIIVLMATAAFALFVSWYDNIQLFPPFELSSRTVAISIVILIGILILAELLLQARSIEERKELWVRQVIPRNSAEKVVWVISSSVAGMTEEIIFRGVLFALLLALAESVVIAASISAAAFALAHYRQGWKSMGFIAAIAVLFQWLVIYTASLIPAMVVHAVYNIVRGMRASKGMRDLEGVTPRPAA